MVLAIFPSFPSGNPYCSPQISLVLYLFFCFLSYFSWVTALSCFFYVCSFYILKLGQPKACGRCLLFLETSNHNLFVSVAALSINTRVILSAVAPGLLQQWLQYLLCFRLVLVPLQPSSLSSLQVCCCSIHP